MSNIDVDTLKPVPQSFVETAGKFENRTAYRDYKDGEWHAVDWKTFAGQVNTAARALVSLGVKKGQIICILGGNRPEWAILAHAAMAIGCSPAGIYFSCSAEEIEYIVTHSECPLLLCETAEHIERVRSIRKNAKKMKTVVAMDGAAFEGDDIVSWNDFNNLGSADLQAEVDARRDAIDLKDTAVLVYTSGTLGPPKAVVISHQAAAWVPATLKAMFGNDENDRLLSYLPLAHIAELTNTILSHSTSGNEIWYCLDTLTVADRLPECEPTIFFGVPRVWQKIEEKITQRLAGATGVKAKLANWAIATGKEFAVKKLEGEAISGSLKFKHRIADKLILSKVRAALGLTACRLAVSGAAPISRTTLEFMAGLGIVICEVYGQSEDCGPTTFNTNEALKLGTVGKPIPGMELKIADDDEILIRAPSLFDGYLKDPETTNATLVDGWMHTGDLGRIDNQGFVSIIGRKKDIMITAGGKNIAPANIENDMMDIPLVEHAILVGEGKKFLTALVTVSADVLESFAELNNISDPSYDHPEVRKTIATAIDEINTRYARVEQVREFAILDRQLSQEDGELTPTMKMKRSAIIGNHQRVVDALYADAGA